MSEHEEEHEEKHEEEHENKQESKKDTKKESKKELKKEFKVAAKKVKKLNKTPPDEKLLKLYGLYKQATEGDIDIKRPMFFDIKGVAKYDAWEANESMSKEKAMKKYIRLVERLEKKFN